jgi:glycosyltransferase involved in cell wall biosynthesis
MSAREAVDLSVIIPVGARHVDAAALYADYLRGLAATGRNFEIIFVLDGPRVSFARGLEALRAAGEQFLAIGLTRPFGEATAIMAGFARSTGRIILTLPAYHQVEASAIARLVAAIDECDVAIGWRWPRAGGSLERLRRVVYHGLLAWVTRLQFNDIACGARALRRQVLEEIELYGDQHRFIPYLADRHGFRVIEVDVAQSAKDRFTGSYAPFEYLRSLLDIFTVFFLVRFTKKPLRFFGMIGVSTFCLGALWLLVLVFQRQFLDQPLADRPALVLASLLLVLGMQIFALGLLGELIIFTHARQLKDYHVAEIIHFASDATADSDISRRDKSSRPVEAHVNRESVPLD